MWALNVLLWSGGSELGLSKEVSVSLQLISYRAQELFALCDIGFGLYPFEGDAIDDAEDSTALRLFGDDHLCASW